MFSVDSYISVQSSWISYWVLPTIIFRSQKYH